MDVIFWYNVLEAGLWAGFAVLSALFGGRIRGMTTPLRIALTVSFLAFALSDIIETRTGAWWRPPTLLVYKGLCLTSLATCSAWLWKRRRSS